MQPLNQMMEYNLTTVATVSAICINPWVFSTLHEFIQLLPPLSVRYTDPSFFTEILQVSSMKGKIWLFGNLAKIILITTNKVVNFSPEVPMKN